MSDGFNDRFILDSELPKLYGYTASRTTIWREERAGKFPRAVSLSGRRKARLKSELDAHFANLVAARGAGR